MSMVASKSLFLYPTYEKYPPKTNQTAWTTSITTFETMDKRLN